MELDRLFLINCFDFHKLLDQSYFKLKLFRGRKTTQCQTLLFQIG